MPDLEPSSMHSLAPELRSLFPKVILDAMASRQVTDIHVNPDGFCWVKRLDQDQRIEIGQGLSPEDLQRVLLVLARADGRELRKRSEFSAQLPPDPPFRGGRLQAVLPPVVPKLSLSLRMHPRKFLNLEDLVDCGTLDRSFSRQLIRAVREHHNVLIAGGTGTGKTTLLTALVDRIKAQERAERLLVLEETREIPESCLPGDAVRLEVRGQEFDFVDVVRTSLRMDPDRIVVGEVRGPEAFALIDAWSTGHRGGLSTIHAEDVHGALNRLGSLMGRHPQAGRGPFREAIAAAIDLVCVLEWDQVPRLRQIYSVDSQFTQDGGFQLRDLSASSP